jgi:hypothetical protein
VHGWRHGELELAGINGGAEREKERVARVSGLRVVFIGENASRQSERAPGEGYLAQNAPSARWRRGGRRCTGVCACRPGERAGQVSGHGGGPVGRGRRPGSAGGVRSSAQWREKEWRERDRDEGIFMI